MKKIMALVFLLLFSSPCAAQDAAQEAEPQDEFDGTKVGAYTTYRTEPTREQILEDSKPAGLSIVDALLLKKEIIRIGAARIDVLVSRLTDKVEYVWSPPYGRYVRPRFVLQNAQDLYDRRRI